MTNPGPLESEVFLRIHPSLRPGKQLHVWTVNDSRQMSAMIDLGVDNVITDEPERLVKMLEDRAKLSDVERVLLKFRSRLWR